MNIQVERRWNRDEWMIWQKDKFILCIYFYAEPLVSYAEHGHYNGDRTVQEAKPDATR